MNRADHHHGTKPSLSRIIIFDIDGVIALLILLDAVDLRVVAAIALPAHSCDNNHIGVKIDVWTRWRFGHGYVCLVPEITEVSLISDDPVSGLAISTILQLENRGKGNIAV
jgi:hypothetical protein